jgi:ribosomal protein L2
MPIKTFKPYTPSRRFLTMLDKSEITRQTPEKSLTEAHRRTKFAWRNYGMAPRWRPCAEVPAD